ncbi:MAG: 4-alpha-glucanotransferase [Prevotellaceae bacterium]|jgi:4-alpha-glucanotransferase|nr:4-alpha-glucanotransferase [Prevotellaceae bacterium]
MTLSFHIEYRTRWGETVCLRGNLPELGSHTAEAIALHTSDGIHWSLTLEVEAPADGLVRYRYHLMRGEETVRSEWDGVPRSLHLGEAQRHYRLLDAWKERPAHSYFYSSAFTRALRAHPQGEAVPPSPCGGTHPQGEAVAPSPCGGTHPQGEAVPPSPCRGWRLGAYAPDIDREHGLALAGNQPALGSWGEEGVVCLSDARFPLWQVELDAEALTFPVEYKFVLYHRATRRIVAWEEGDNRVMSDPDIAEGQTLVTTALPVSFALPLWKGAGVAIPLFSLRSEQSLGIGDLGDLRQLIAWAADCGQRVVQLLPVNDTTLRHTWTDSYPYNALSIYALHPLYLDVRQLPPLDDAAEAARFREEGRRLNALPLLDYEAVSRLKRAYLHRLYRQEGVQTLVSAPFRRFFGENRGWLQPYAAFCYLRDAYGTPDFHAWPEHSRYQAEEIELLCRADSPHYPEVALHYFVQYHLHCQLQGARDYARRRGVVLKGDVPIGISRHSVEAWSEPHYFHFDTQTGAPPDDFAPHGQNWGFPTYNWEAMARDDYAWWRKRLTKMADYFDAYRLDHILGFFRIWEIPGHAVHGLLGQFAPALPVSAGEIERCGMTFDAQRLLQPLIDEALLEELFGVQAGAVKESYLEPVDSSEAPLTYRMRPAYRTERQVQQHLGGRTDAAAARLREGLYKLLANVLFVPDRTQADAYHPRIAVQQEQTYRSLPPREQAAFDGLYEEYFYHRHNDFWRRSAMGKLPRLLEATGMLVCGEDLGMIPDCVPQVMNELHLLSLEVERMPKVPGQAFGRPADYPYASVCTTSTHDLSTLRGWWEEEPQLRARYYREVLGGRGEVPETATPEVCEAILCRQLQAGSMLCILPLQDWLSIDAQLRSADAAGERINVPSDPHHYWRWRMHLTLEQLRAADTLNRRIRELIDMYR